MFARQETFCYLCLAALTAAGCVTDKVPIQLNITLHSMLIIAVGSFKSLEEMLRIMKKIHVDRNYEGEEGIEQMSFDDAWQFPIVAGCSLCGLYCAINYFGKEAVNYFLLIYIAVGGSSGVKAMVTSFAPNAFDAYDKKKLINVQVKTIGLDIQATLFDLLCCAISCLLMGLYAQYKNIVFNNIMALIFCLHALQSMFIGNFKNGFLLLTLLFFYDIFFVFGTDVMLTVAKGIDAPIKLQFPQDYSGEKPKYSILGLGDIVIPGIFVSLCLRFDFLKALDIKHFEGLLRREAKGEDVSATKYMLDTAASCDKHYFRAVNFGYFLAIVATIVVMLVFEHG